MVDFECSKVDSKIVAALPITVSASQVALGVKGDVVVHTGLLGVEASTGWVALP